jgi:YVTN family beta-propeller protein
MQRRKRPVFWFIGALLGYALLVMAFSMVRGAIASQGGQPIGPAAIFARPTYSSPIAISQNNALVWSVNPDDDSVSVIRTDTNVVIKKINVGDEPQSIALDPNNAFAYVANAADNSVTIIHIVNANPSTFDARVDNAFCPNSNCSPTTGAEPWNIVISPDGNRVFVANSGQDTITVINATTHGIIGDLNLDTTVCNDHTGDNVGDPAYHFQPRGLAVTQNNDRLYVSRFLSFVKQGGVQASDVGKEGVVCEFTLNTAGTTASTVLSAPTKITLGQQITGFKAVINNVPIDTSAYPNQIQSIVIRGNQAYVPNIAASPSPPLKFNVDTQAFVNVIDSAASGAPVDASAAKFLNLHLGARIPEAGKTKLFFANPWAIAFTNQSGAGNAYVVSAGSDLLVKVNVDAAGKLSFTGGISTTRYIDLNDPNNPQTSGLNAGKNPLGIAINDAGTTAYVMNYVSRSVSIVNLTTDSVTKVVRTTELPPPDTLDEIIQVGKEMFFSSRGNFDRPPGTTVSTNNRLSSEGWQNCASCHFAGLTDGNIWSFNSGPRKSVPLNGTWNPHNPDDQRLLNYSAIFDEVQDFEANIRNVSGPGNKSNGPPPVLDENHGLLFGDDGDINKAPGVVNNFAKPNAGRPQHTVTLPGSTVAVPALDALKEWVRFNVRTPNGALTTAELTAGGNNPLGGNGGISQTSVDQGRALFFKAGCQTCHGGGKWSNSNVDFLPPPPTDRVAQEAPATSTTIVSISYIADALRDIKSFGLGVAGGTNPIGNNIGGIEKSTDNKDALGKDHNGDGKGNGFNVSSLLGIWGVPPYYHNGACETLACVLTDVNHRKAGTGTDVLASQLDRDRLVAFLQSLDQDTLPATNLYIERHDIFFDPPAVIAGTTVNVGVNISLFGPKSDIAQPLTVKFYDGPPGAAGTVEISPPGGVTLNAGDFNQNFGQATKTVPWNVPATPGVHFVFATVDTGGVLAEANENDNTAGRRIRTRPIPPDRTPPVIDQSSVTIDNGAPVTSSEDATVTFKASDPTSPSPQSTSGLDSFCIVRYTYDTVRRRWVEQNCVFQPLPAPNGDGSFTVHTQLKPKEGTAYAFVWVRDKAGNIARDPGFDVISFIPSPTTDIEMDRNDVRTFRITLNPGQAVSFSVTPDIGDVDLFVFQSSSLITKSANSGTNVDTVTFSNTSASPALFQVEVHAVVNSRFRITANVTLASLLRAAPQVVGPAKVVPTAPLVSGPPIKAAVEGGQDVVLPMIRR